MKTRFFAMLAVIGVMVSLQVVNAETIMIGDQWGTAVSDVQGAAYVHKYADDPNVTSNVKDYYVKIEGTTSYIKSNYGSYTSGYKTADTWDYRKSLLEKYLSGVLIANTMNNTAAIANATGNYGLLASSAHRVQKIDESKNVDGYQSIYGRAAESLSGNTTASGVAANMFRENQSAAILSASQRLLEGTDHNWTYDSVNDTFTSSSLTTKSDGIGDHNDGIYAFVTGFEYNPVTTYQYLNGWFAELGEFLGVYINGFELTKDYLWLSDDYMESDLFVNYDMEINLAKLYEDDILKVGNNNIAFMIDTIKPDYFGGTLYDGNDGLLAFASGLNLNTESILAPPPAATPEPATLLIFGIGLAGLGIRRKLMSKMSA
ncbi:MAG: PEP-CTERM sorting domain-containing protein [Planctomycetaceae bacterium]|nr:PEP-CTERM sorting domain-containing protein [Planctomycetaceae bacterium]